MYKQTVNLVWTSALVFAGLLTSSCQSSQTPKVKRYSAFTEMTDPARDSIAQWTATPSGLNASFVSIDNKYDKSIEPSIKTPKTTDRVIGWQGERLSAQILLWTTSEAKEIEYSIRDFKGESKTLPSSIADLRFVRYVMTDEFAGGCGYRKPENFDQSLAPDMLDNINVMDIEANTVRPIWVSVAIPTETPAGLYTSEIEISATNEPTQTFTLEVEVQNAVLPAPSTWTYHLDLWQHPAAVARAQNLEMWSDAHFEAMKPLMKMLADAGQKVITTTLNKDPWNNQTYDAYEDMIIWTKEVDGTWTYDYTIFDKWVNFMMDLGINKMINAYSVVPWNNELHYKDATTGEFVNLQANPGTEIFDQVWHSFFVDFKKHLVENDWLEITNIAMDERSPAEMEKTIAMLQKEAPELGISYADNQKSYKKYPFVKDISIEAGASYDRQDIIDRQEKGLITTYYVCCSDKFPNMFTFSGSAESVYAGWYALAGGFDGFLRWAYNSWVERPLEDSRFRTWPAGDTYMVYPDARSSIRFERLVEGIQDVEKVKALRVLLQNSQNPKAPELLDELNNTVATFATIHPTDYVKMVNDAKALVGQITNELTK